MDLDTARLWHTGCQDCLVTGTQADYSCCPVCVFQLRYWCCSAPWRTGRPDRGTIPSISFHIQHRCWTCCWLLDYCIHSLDRAGCRHRTANLGHDGALCCVYQDSSRSTSKRRKPWRSTHKRELLPQHGLDFSHSLWPTGLRGLSTVPEARPRRQLLLWAC